MVEAIFHGHACVEIRTENTTILIDPFITDNPVTGLTLEEVAGKNITHICITHGHGDHLGDTIELSKRFPKAQIITVYGVAKYLATQDVANLHGYGIGGIYIDPTADLSIKFVVAIHDGGILETGLSTQPAGLVLTLQGKKIYHAGDTALTSDMAFLASTHLDLAFLPIGAIYTMGVEDAVIATSLIKPKIVVPIHYNTRPKIAADDQEFARAVMLGNHAVPKVLKPGQAVVL